MSHIKFKVVRSGLLYVAVSDDTYPGTTMYFMVGGKRYSGPVKVFLPLDATALAMLKQEKLIDFTYSDWPYRQEINRKDIFAGFAKAYDDCVAFLSGTNISKAAPRATAPAALPDDEPSSGPAPISLLPKN